ncbi:hypothetical protein OL548_20255 [Lysinibacillus sp. MHQ-1]|nr:hypothetical protein OL548_20255 [Lysinibacillus sp. MHQ-1]
MLQLNLLLQALFQIHLRKVLRSIQQEEEAFFIFGGSRSTSSSSKQSNSSVQSSANSVTVRFTNPQILGYYLEATAADKSVNINNTETSSNTDFISILEFVTKFQKNAR